MRRVSGECIAGCGLCCELLIVPLVRSGEYIVTSDDGGNRYLLVYGAQDAKMSVVLELRGSKQFSLRDGVFWMIPLDDVGEGPLQEIEYGPRRCLLVRSTCLNLTAEKKCAIHSRRPDVCRDFPTPRDDLSTLPGCGYAITDD